MAKPEQTEKATPKRVREARNRGQVARSADLGSAVVFTTLILMLHVGFTQALGGAETAMQMALRDVYQRHDPTVHTIFWLFVRAALPFVGVLGLMFAVAAGAALAINYLQFGLLFTFQAIQPKLSKLNPISGLQRVLFSKQTLVNLLKQFLKLGIVGVIIYLTIKDRVPQFYEYAHASPVMIAMQLEGLLFSLGLRFGILLIILGALDYFWEKRQLADSLKMTKQEIKEEHRQSDLAPEVRGQVRARQRAASRKRMMANVPKATVVVTNPTHFAVALEWDEIKMDAPVVTAKGADLMAKRIREVAKEYKIPILENPPLARTLYQQVELDTPVPPNLYSAVAQVIAFVYKLKNRTIA